MSRPGGRELTVGVEWEFMVPAANSYKDPHKTDGRFYISPEQKRAHSSNHFLRKHIATTLKDVVPIIDADKVGTSTARNVARKWKLNIDPSKPYFDYFWTLDIDYSLVPCPGEDVEGDYDYFSHASCMEIQSRVLRESEIDEITAVWKQLRRTYRIHVNSSCSVHVHVGTDHFTLDNHKRLAILVMAGEAFLFRACERHRRNSMWCPPISQASAFAIGPYQASPRERGPLPRALAALLPDWMPAYMARAAAGVWAAADLPALRAGLKQPTSDGWDAEWVERCAFAIRGEQDTQNCEAGERPAAPTVEFRYSHASGDPVRDCAWVRLCAALVRKAAEATDADYRHALTLFVAPSGSWHNFLLPLGLDGEFDLWVQEEVKYINKATPSAKPPTEFMPPI